MIKKKAGKKLFHFHEISVPKLERKRETPVRKKKWHEL